MKACLNNNNNNDYNNNNNNNDNNNKGNSYLTQYLFIYLSGCFFVSAME